MKCNHPKNGLNHGPHLHCPKCNNLEPPPKLTINTALAGVIVLLLTFWSAVIFYLWRCW